FVLTDFGFPRGAIATGVTLLPGGWIVVGGTASDGHNSDFMVARFRANGLPDSDFGTGGVTLTDFHANSTDIAFGVALQPDGDVVLAGLSEGPGPTDFALARYTPHGQLDQTFGPGGAVLAGLGVPAIGWGVAIQSDKKIVVSGLVQDGV